MTAASAAPIVVAHDVQHRYGRTLALECPALTLPCRSMVGLIGPDGAGKSTLLALIAGVKRLQHGRLQVLGANMAQKQERTEAQRRIAYLPQGLGRNLYPTLSVEENVAYFARLFGVPPRDRAARIAALLAATGLLPFRQRAAGHLSGGMKQKLGLCCALVRDPQLLILDEPTTGVDPLSRRQFWQLLARLRAQRPDMTVLVATAYMEEAEAFDFLVAMTQGQILATGTSAELRAQTGARSLDEAYLALLPSEARAHHQPPVRSPLPPSSEPPVIEVRGLTKRFGDFVAVDHVDLTVRRGEIFGFLGSNGCGKTTTIKMMTGLLPPSEGTVCLFGHPVAADDLANRRDVGYVSQSFSLYGELTVRENLLLHAKLFHLPSVEASVRVETLLDEYDLRPHADDQAESLPMGIRQRLSLAVALVHRPRLLILDEPTSGVDPVARDAFWCHLIELSRRDGVTIFITTHFMNEAERCDRLALMHAGRLLAEGTPEELRAQVSASSLQEAFIAYLEAENAVPPLPQIDLPPRSDDRPAPAFSLKRLLACARREAIELLQDRIRMAFALLGSLILLFVLSYGISFDIEKVRFAVLDHDDSP